MFLKDNNVQIFEQSKMINPRHFLESINQLKIDQKGFFQCLVNSILNQKSRFLATKIHFYQYFCGQILAPNSNLSKSKNCQN